MELNPGPTNIKYPSGKCSGAVKFGPSITYDQCNVWYHQDCEGMNSTMCESCTNATIEMN